MFHQPMLARRSTDDESLKALGINISMDKFRIEDEAGIILQLDSAFGKLEKDYNKYIELTCFPYGIGETGYNSLLKTISGNFKRRHFKRVIAHMAKYSSTLPAASWELICQICRQQKIPMTLYEISALLIQRNLIRNQVSNFTFT